MWLWSKDNETDLTVRYVFISEGVGGGGGWFNIPVFWNSTLLRGIFSDSRSFSLCLIDKIYQLVEAPRIGKYYGDCMPLIHNL